METARGGNSKKSLLIWKENKVVALRVRLIPQCMLNEFIYIMCVCCCYK